MNRLIITATMADGQVHEVPINNATMVAWEFEARDKGWPPQKEAPFLWMTFLAWDALCRAGDYPRTEDGTKQTTFKTFRETDCLDVDSRNEDGSPMGPTRPDSADSASP